MLLPQFICEKQTRPFNKCDNQGKSNEYIINIFPNYASPWLHILKNGGGKLLWFSPDFL